MKIHYIHIMENQDACKLEKLVVNIIQKIRNERNRACYQNIFTFINRGGHKVEIDALKELLGDMVEKQIIVNKGKNDKESFYVNDNHSIDIQEEETTAVNNGNDEVNNLIDEAFHDILINKIRSEVKIAVNAELQSLRTSNALHPINISEPMQYEKNINRVLLKSLNSEIAFLRKELESKNTIIKMLLSDRDNSKLNNKKENEISVLPPKHTIENKNASKVDLNKISEVSMNDDNFEKSTPEKSKNRRNITILGDSLLKDMKAFKMRQGLFANERVYIKSFPGAKTNVCHTILNPH